MFTKNILIVFFVLGNLQANLFGPAVNVNKLRRELA